MKFIDKNGKSFTLEVIGYEFPRFVTRDEHDRNWLQIKIAVDGLKAPWKATSPMLLTWEVEKLSNWLESQIANPKCEKLEMFIEPNLLFEIVNVHNSDRTLRIYFELEARPTWAPSDGAGEEDLYLDLQLSVSDLESAVHSLNMQLANFPER